jgi:hypothetical protein
VSDPSNRHNPTTLRKRQLKRIALDKTGVLSALTSRVRYVKFTDAGLNILRRRV